MLGGQDLRMLLTKLDTRTLPERSAMMVRELVQKEIKLVPGRNKYD